MKDTSAQACDKWSVLWYTVLNQSFWISGEFNDVFVSGLCSWVSLPFHSESWVVTFSSVRACFSLPVSGFLSVHPVSWIFLATKSVLQFTFENFDKIFKELYFLNWFKYFTRTVSSLLNDRLHYRCIVTALKLLFTIMFFPFVYKHKNCV